MLLQETPRGWPSRLSFKVATFCPGRTGASRGCRLSMLAFNLSLVPLGSARFRSALKPALTSFAAPFQTRSVVTGWCFA